MEILKFQKSNSPTYSIHSLHTHTFYKEMNETFRFNITKGTFKLCVFHFFNSKVYSFVTKLFCMKFYTGTISKLYH